LSSPSPDVWRHKIAQVEGENVIESEEIKILTNPTEIRQIYVDLINSAKSEISLIIATPNALRRNLTGGIIDMLRVAAQKRNVKVNLVIPAYEDQIYTVTDSFQRIGLMPTIQNFQVKTILPMTRQTHKIKSTFLVIDRKTSFIIDVKDDTKQNLIDAVGFASYYNSRSRTESYRYIFETIWRQADLYESLARANKGLKEAYEQLKIHDAMEKEFINIAAHELRTPAQAVIGYAEMLKKFPDRNKNYEDAILRNAERLYGLVTKMLDVARIESQSLTLDKTSIDLNEKIQNVIRDVSQQAHVNQHKKVPIIFEAKEPITISADKARMFQVFANLLNNALEFTNDGNIVINASKSEKTNEAIVTITDSGTGLDPEIVPHLFSKFRTKSDKGIGLGLYIVKNIVEAHGGRIEAHNNINAKGATFTVLLPLLG
jgi:two-component system, OmpR family, sensor histidine kinase VicK